MSTANLTDAEKVVATTALLDQGQTNDFDKLKEDLATTANDAARYDILEARSLKLQNRLSPVLRAVTFMPYSRADSLLRSITSSQVGIQVAHKRVFWMPIKKLPLSVQTARSEQLCIKCSYFKRLLPQSNPVTLTLRARINTVLWMRI